MNNRLILALAMSGLLSAPAFAAQDKTAALADTCNNCHGVNGVSVGESMPSIGGLSETYLKTVMLQWKSGERYSATMGRLIKGYSEQQIADLAKFFAAKPWVPVVQKIDAKIVAQGKAASDRCSTCHGDTGSEPDDDETPMIHGQWAKYMELEMMKYRDDAVAMPHRKMRGNSKRLADEDVAAVAKYYAAQQK
jgi:cytochrome subunit of sulfide dehydrogenase